MKITKKQLRQIIRSTQTEILNESRFGSVGLGFQGWSANQKPNFAKAYGKDARVIRDFGSNEFRKNQVQESGLKIPADPAYLAEDAAHAALMHIQDNMGIESGDVASMWPGWDQLLLVLKDYINFEIEEDPGWHK